MPLNQNSVITQIDNLVQFRDILTSRNPGYFVMKLGAEWCGPCKRIESLVVNCMSQLPNTVQCSIIDVDESFELYAFLKKNRVVNGIPVILAYKQGNTHFVPDKVVIGADESQILAFFNEITLSL